MEEAARAASPIMLVIAGHNGAGKSTCYRKYFKDSFGQRIPLHLDPDVLEKELRVERLAEGFDDNAFSRLAQEDAAACRMSWFEDQKSFSFETVFSDPVGEKVRFIEAARAQGYVVGLIAVGLASPELSIARVAARVAKGGHHVPEDRIMARYPRVLQNFCLAACSASVTIFIDNSEESDEDDGDSYHPFAIVHGAQTEIDPPVPAWGAHVMANLRTP